jgi:hypothetical protein
MGSYLTDEHFGEPAAHVLAGQWRIANEPQKDETFRIGLDLSRVREKRAERIANPDATSAEAEAIFAAIEPMVADSATEGEKRRGVALGVVAARLPHGRREGTIQKLIALSPRRTRSKLLLNLVLSGEEIDIKVVADGVAETFAAAEKEEWILTQGDGYELRDWLRLLPFVNRLADALVILRLLIVRRAVLKSSCLSLPTKIRASIRITAGARLRCDLARRPQHVDLLTWLPTARCRERRLTNGIWHGNCPP